MKYTPAIPAVPIRTVVSAPETLTKSELKTTQKAFIANLRAQNPSSSKKPNGKSTVKLVVENEEKQNSEAFIANLRAQNPSSSKKPNGKSKVKLVVENEEKQNSDAMHENDMASFDISEVPPPICSCTGVSRKCYRSGPGGWQSTCCTTSLSVYPLPPSLTRPGKRVAGRKISKGVYRKVLRRLVKDGHDISQPVDLKNYWGKHGTNKFVTIN